MSEQLSPEEQQERARINNAIAGWMSAKDVAAEYTLAERTARDNLARLLFPVPKKGTQRYQSPEGYGAIKLVFGLNYTLGDKDKVTEEGKAVLIAEQVAAALMEIRRLRPGGEELADKLVKWKPELSVSTYEGLDLTDPNEAYAKKVIDTILTVKPKAPEMEYEAPKKR